MEKKKRKIGYKVIDCDSMTILQVVYSEDLRDRYQARWQELGYEANVDRDGDLCIWKDE